MKKQQIIIFFIICIFSLKVLSVIALSDTLDIHNETVIFPKDYARYGIPMPPAQPKLPTFFDLDLTAQIEIIAFAVLGAAVAIIAFVKFYIFGKLSRSKSSILKNPQRSSIYNYIKDNPGINMGKLSSILNMNFGTFRYHLYILKQGRLVSAMQDGNNIRLFGTLTISEDHKKVIAAARNGSKRKILEVILENPGISNGGIAMKLAMSESSISRHVKQLSEDGIVVNGGSTTNTKYNISKDKEDQIIAALDY
jgi:predicted transcriptional regulator